MFNNKDAPSKYKITITILTFFVQICLFSIISYILNEIVEDVDKYITQYFPKEFWVIALLTIPGRFFLKHIDPEKLYSAPWIIFPIGISFLIYFFIGIIIDAVRYALFGDNQEEPF
ncbi:hypothetical protein GF362_01925 [Candidatus Dojkabacteria bacterium]|nr:hypothetical protein [Candidatus Dojkabacteria bacterium]